MKTAKGMVIFPVILYCFLFLVASDDTITSDKPIKDGDLLLSKEKKFALGFFTPGKSSYRYVGIWYHNLPKLTIVWVANRDDPINDTSGLLSISPDGNLVLHHNTTNSPIWSTNVPVTVPNTPITAQLSDIGNLVLTQNDSKSILWQSFDHPTDTLLPHAKVGVNKRTGQTWILQSWKTEDDPGTGSFTLRFNTSGKAQEFMYSNNLPWWRGGSSNGEILVGIPSMKQAMLTALNIYVTDNDNEVRFVYDAIEKNIIYRLAVLPSGYYKLYKWDYHENEWALEWSAPEVKCDYYGSCGSNSNCDPLNFAFFRCSCLPGYEPENPTNWYQNGDGSGGCVRKKGPSMCGNGEGFVTIRKVKIPDTSIVNVKPGLSLEECERECLRNCSCNAYAAADVRNGGSGCLTWHGTLMDTQILSQEGHDLYVRVDAVELAKYARKPKRSHAMARMVGIPTASITFIALLVVFIVYRFQKRERRDEITMQQLSLDSPFAEEQGENIAQPSLSFFSIKTIMAATNNFSNENQLGRGGFGCVYKGSLVDGQEIAVKRLSKVSSRGTQEFKNEIKLIVKLQHRNLVKLLGYCIDKKERMLIYEYLPNKSLDFYLFDMNRRSTLDWDKRFHIIFGITRGVIYLHEDSRLKIIHRNLKASNVLLDATMNPKISDFGTARIFGEDQIQARTRRIVGTYGYMSPEYAMEGQYSTKSDVFSFGILLLEIISGKRNTDRENGRLSLNLIGHVWELWRKGKTLEIVDSLLGESYPVEVVLRYIQIGLLCVQECALDRPSMREVISMLGNEGSLPSPKKPAFLFNSNIWHSESSGEPSIYDITHTTISVR